MCWVGKKSQKHIAKEDVKVFKIVYKEVDTWKVLDKGYVCEYYPPYYTFRYKVGETYSIDNFEASGGLVYKKHMNRIIIDKGFHSYSTEYCSVGLNENKTHVSVNSACINHLLITLASYEIGHTRITKKLRQNMGVTKLECVIPAGTEYWENEQGEIVSPVIKVIKETPINKTYQL